MPYRVDNIMLLFIFYHLVVLGSCRRAKPTRQSTVVTVLYRKVKHQFIKVYSCELLTFVINLF